MNARQRYWFTVILVSVIGVMTWVVVDILFNIDSSARGVGGKIHDALRCLLGAILGWLAAERYSEVHKKKR